ncbi:MAG: hypothetical protein PHP42_11730 [Bacteroidota bacterium]|nr:hypothetical protein [Bacteroidota bacterium]
MQKNFPLRNAAETTKAAHWLSNYYTYFPFQERRAFAERILTKAAEYSIVLDKKVQYKLEKLAGRGIGFLDQIIRELEKRAEWLNRRSQVTAAKKFTKTAERLKQMNIRDFYKKKLDIQLGQQLDAFDKEAGIHVFYHKEFLPPEDFIYSNVESEKDDFEDSLIPNIKTGNYYTASDLADLNVKAFEDAFGTEVAAGLSVAGLIMDKDSVKRWLKTAELNHAQLFDEVMQLHGIRPKFQKLPEE